ncbi:carbohydrate kinase family protein [Ulvibacter antarcticus]|uniref:Fructokinase n=1 Tax=Ulvibacter antarcticus TaxID=442714 RepID=A0A3L9YWY5_9FLAO|nr:carbohydrate kinase [Ulvibacter antarcticus]RMA64337.1 fructokinase [Ulvibacter antarcticus]
MKNIVCFGEILWDVFPNHKKIGGAPLNVAFRLKSFENNVSIISSIGDDTKGEEIIDLIKKRGISVEHIQIDGKLKTGKVNVMLNRKGSASYDIKFPRAWDNIQLTEDVKNLAKNADAFIFGSLIARNDVSRNTLYELLKLASYKIFDVNLREPYYTNEVLNHLMGQADFIKFNDDEIFEISKQYGASGRSLEQTVKFIAEQTNTNSICVTKGRHGAILYDNGNFYYNSGYQIKVVDTVGAGDSFLASLINELLKKSSPQKAIDFACVVGAIVASSEGANPEIKKSDIDRFITS